MPIMVIIYMPIYLWMGRTVHPLIGLLALLTFSYQAFAMFAAWMSASAYQGWYFWESLTKLVLICIGLYWATYTSANFKEIVNLLVS